MVCWHSVFFSNVAKRAVIDLCQPVDLVCIHVVGDKLLMTLAAVVFSHEHHAMHFLEMRESGAGFANEHGEIVAFFA